MLETHPVTLPQIKIHHMMLTTVEGNLWILAPLTLKIQIISPNQRVVKWVALKSWEAEVVTTNNHTTTITTIICMVAAEATITSEIICRIKEAGLRNSIMEVIRETIMAVAMAWITMEAIKEVTCAIISSNTQGTITIITWRVKVTWV